MMIRRANTYRPVFSLLGKPAVAPTTFVLGIVVLSLLSTRPVVAAAEGDTAPRPNVVFILADDLGWTDLGCYGTGYYETPHIDALRADGLKFTDAYTAAPNCAPTRACLMTGRYTPRHGIYTVGSGARGEEQFRRMVPVENVTDLPLTEQTVADVLHSAGYTTGMFGKWHLGRADAYHPTRRGFDEGIVTRGGHFSPNFEIVPPPGTPEIMLPEGEYLARFLTDRAVDFIARHAEASKAGTPFFLYLPHFAVHSPIQAPKESVDRFVDKPPVGGHNFPTYAGMIAEVDDSVGRVLATLDQYNLADDTVVIFSSDNGGVGGYGALGTASDDLSGGTVRNITDNAPLRGGKGMLYEGGVRVPLVVRWPGHVEPGGTCDEPVISVDLLPTLAELAGARLDESIERDGVSFAPLLADPTGSLDREALYWHFPGYLQANVAKGTWRTTPAGAIRVGDYKLIEFFEDGHRELYHLATDPGQHYDLATMLPDIADQLQGMLFEWRRRVDAPLPSLKVECYTARIPHGRTRIGFRRRAFMQRVFGRGRQ